MEFCQGMVVYVTSDDEESLFLISRSESSAASDSGEDEGKLFLQRNCSFCIIP